MASLKDYLKEVSEEKESKGKSKPLPKGKKGKVKETEEVDFDYSKKDKAKLKGPFGKNTDAMSLQGRGDIKQRVTNARYGDNPLEEEEIFEDELTKLDQLQDILHREGANDTDIIGGVHLDDHEKQRVAAELGTSAREIDTLLASLISRLQSDSKTNMIQEVDPTEDRGGIVDGRFSYEGDGLGSMTLRDSKSGEEKFLQGHEATDLANEIERVEGNPNKLQDVLQRAFLSETSAFDSFFLREFQEDNFDKEIAADSGTYNMPWSLNGSSGFMTIFFSDSSGKPHMSIQSIRDTEGEEIEIGHAEHDQLMDQAKEFIQKEFS